jgi:hypothetical protein
VKVEKLELPPTLKPLAAWRAGAKLRDRKVRVRGEARVRPGGDGLFVEFFGQARRLIIAAVAEDKAGPLAGRIKDEECWVVTIEGTVKHTDGGLTTFDEAELLKAEAPEVG